MALSILKGAWRSLLLRRLLPGAVDGASLPLLLRGAQAAQAAPQRCASHSASRGALLASTAGDLLRSSLDFTWYCEGSADVRSVARPAQRPRSGEGWARAGGLPGAASAPQGPDTTQAGAHSDRGAHAATCSRRTGAALAQQLRRSALADSNSLTAWPGAPRLWWQQRRGFVNFLPGLNGDVSKQYHERRLIGCASLSLYPCCSLPVQQRTIKQGRCSCACNFAQRLSYVTAESAAPL